MKLRLDHHLILFANLDPAHLSSDEPAFGTNDKQAQFKLYYIIEAAWQSPAFKKFVCALDQWYLYHSRPKVGMKQRGGNLPHIREELPKGKACVIDSIAPCRLWRNCYDEDWVKNLKVSEREDLNMIDDDYDFMLPPPPPIPDEFLAHRPTTSSSGMRRSAQGRACTSSNTPPLFDTPQGPATFTNPNASFQPTSPPRSPAPPPLPTGSTFTYAQVASPLVPGAAAPPAVAFSGPVSTQALNSPSVPSIALSRRPTN